MDKRFCTRDELMRTLRISRSASYRVIGTSKCRLVSAKDVLSILNNSRMGGQPILTEMPSELVTCAEVAERIGGDVRPRDVLNWTRRLLNRVPYFQLNPHCRRFSMESVMAWLESRARIVRRG